ncbi:MAG: TraR/DksA family transcriptional regulator [Nitrospirae bacterium]|nr:TraR/DksA family transcriptional regulator [Nitrospirota bacterium]
MDKDNEAVNSTDSEAANERAKGIRKVLIQERQIILKEAKTEIGNFVKGDEKQLVEAALDDGDWSVVDVNEDIILQKLHHHKLKLNKIDEALRKLNEGSYGICDDCGIEISDARLKVLPFAVHCVECKEKREKIEQVEKEQSFQ